MKYHRILGEVNTYQTGDVYELSEKMLRSDFNRWDLPSLPIDAPECIVCGCTYRVEWHSFDPDELNWFPAQKITLRSLMQ